MPTHTLNLCIKSMSMINLTKNKTTTFSIEKIPKLTISKVDEKILNLYLATISSNNY